MSRTDLRSQPFETTVVLGESSVAGMCATSEARRWVNLLASLVSEFQGHPMRLVNSGISANAISPRSPGFEASAQPSALERLERDVIAHQPDLFVCAYGLHDMRCQMPPRGFSPRPGHTGATGERDMQPGDGSDYRLSYDRLAALTPFDKGSPEATEVFNLVIRQVAEQEGAILADIWAVRRTADADRMIRPDGVHANDLGHRIIAHRVFEALAQHCSCLALSSQRG